MSYDAQLQFVRDLLRGMHISSHIADEPDIRISNTIDLGLRNLIFGYENYRGLLQNSMSQARSNAIYRFFDEYYCNYIFLRLPNETAEQYFFIGPYLLEAPSKARIQQKLQPLGLSHLQAQAVFRLYTTFPVVEDENLLITIASTLGNSLWGSSEHFSLEYIEYMIPDRTAPLSIVPSAADPGSPISLAALESNYENERLLMEAVSQGSLHKVTAIAYSVFNNGTEPRLPDSLRDRKNYLIILNTLLRKAAEYGGVHPLHLNRLSSSFAQEIEQVYTIRSSLHLQEEMIREYCLLVKRHSLRDYSHLVGRAITMIHFDLLADLSLKTIAAQLNVTPSYLSGRFKKECGCTLTDYVNKKRIEKALSLLNTSDRQIQDIAFECGIPDTNYFIRLFKKNTGMTPTQYRAQSYTPAHRGRQHLTSSKT